MRKKRKMRKVQYLLCLAGLETVWINPGNVLILIWRRVSNLIYSPQLNSDWGCSSLDWKLSVTVFSLIHHFWHQMLEFCMGGRQEGERSILDLSGQCVCSWMRHWNVCAARAETCQIPGSNSTTTVLPQEMNLEQECQPEKCTRLCSYLRAPAGCGSSVRLKS